MRKELGPLIHRESPAVVAIRPSSEDAYSTVTNGKPFFDLLNLLFAIMLKQRREFRKGSKSGWKRRLAASKPLGEHVRESLLTHGTVNARQAF